jgi:hypothetical protein
MATSTSGGSGWNVITAGPAANWKTRTWPVWTESESRSLSSKKPSRFADLFKFSSKTRRSLGGSTPNRLFTSAQISVIFWLVRAVKKPRYWIGADQVGQKIFMYFTIEFS